MRLLLLTVLVAAAVEGASIIFMESMRWEKSVEFVASSLCVGVAASRNNQIVLNKSRSKIPSSAAPTTSILAISCADKASAQAGRTAVQVTPYFENVLGLVNVLKVGRFEHPHFNNIIIILS